jgi:DNA-binding NarL/FixJ family response regulator
MRIVVVDDSAVARRIFARLASAAGHEVVAESADADDAIDQVARRAPDAVVIDGRLPPHGASALIERLRERRPDMRIVIVASLDERDLVVAAAAAGASAALLRPLLPSRVAEALDPSR